MPNTEPFSFSLMSFEKAGLRVYGESLFVSTEGQQAKSFAQVRESLQNILEDAGALDAKSEVESTDIPCQCVGTMGRARLHFP